MKKKILVVAAHPDDEVLGCGAAVARFVKEGHSVTTVVLGEGVTARYGGSASEKQEREKKKLKEQMTTANRLLGVSKVYHLGLPDNKLDTIPLLEIVQRLEDIKRQVMPDTVYTHHWGDLNIDHRIAYNAVMTACRPVPGERVKEIYAFEVPSSSEWAYPRTFDPTVYIDVEKSIMQKVKAMRCYRSEIRPAPHPRSAKSLLAVAQRWGSVSGCTYAEAFQLVRAIR
ncbi:MAG: PIG-L deacetylase family protein [Candidatus Omnitrophota bacterium]|jgi:LmbE family N-acetylglucosaminyl deacetylase